MSDSAEPTELPPNKRGRVQYTEKAMLVINAIKSTLTTAYPDHALQVLHMIATLGDAKLEEVTNSNETLSAKCSELAATIAAKDTDVDSAQLFREAEGAEALM